MDFNAMDSLFVMLNVESLDFSNVQLIRQQNSIPKAEGCLNFPDSAAHIMSRLGTLFAIAKSRPPLSHTSQGSTTSSSID
jgi:hypothetical protein